MDLLKDPAGDRAVKTLKAPPHRTLDKKLLFPDRLKGGILHHNFKL
jgi:serine/threonine-protein phosphatase 2B catalytic subunit